MDSTTRITRSDLRAKIEATGAAFWAARCDAFDEPDTHVIAWDWIRESEPMPEPGVHFVAGSVRVSHPDMGHFIVTE